MSGVVLPLRLPLHAAGLRVAEAPALYRPRRPQRTTFYRLLDEHFEDYARVHSERYERRSGPLRPVIRRCVDQFLDCGRHESGFARLRCGTCAAEHLIAFSCQTRNFCPSCQAKRAASLAAHLVEDVLLPVPHRHFVFTVPKALRGLFERERRLLSLLCRSAYDAVRSCFQSVLGRRDALPGMVVSLQTFGSFGNWHPHVHALVSDGLLERGGGFLPLETPDVRVMEERFRRLLLGRLHRAERLCDAFLASLLSWEHSGFSVHAGEPIGAEEPQAIERVGRYLARAPVSLAKVSSQEDGTVKLLTPKDARTGRDSRVFDPLDWVHAITTQIPEPRQHMVRYYGAYSNRARRLYRAAGDCEDEENAVPAAPAARVDQDGELALTVARRRSWARLLRRVYEVDPLLCPRCGGELKIVAVITDPVVVSQTLSERSESKGTASWSTASARACTVRSSRARRPGREAGDRPGPLGRRAQTGVVGAVGAPVAWDGSLRASGVLEGAHVGVGCSSSASRTSPGAVGERWRRWSGRRAYSGQVVTTPYP